MAAGNSEEVDAAACDRDFTQRNDENGWSYPLVFYNTADTKEGPPEKKKAKMGSASEKRTIFVDRCGLANGSPVFRKIFFDTNFVDASKPALVMAGKNFDEFLEFINCIATTYESDEKKPVDIDNLELLLRFAEEYQMRSLKKRCAAFVTRMVNELSIKDYDQRQTLGRLFVICHRTDNTALLSADVATKQISRFPFREIHALDVNQQTKFDLLTTKGERYDRLSCAAKEPPKRRQVYSVTKCSVCKCDIGGDVVHFCCFACLLDGRWYDYCSDCFDAHHVPAHKAGAHICPDCGHVFTISNYYLPDQCGCF